MINFVKSLFSIKLSNYYARILISFVTCIVITIIILSTVLYKSFEKIAMSKIYLSEKQSLSQTSYSADILTESAKTLMLQIYGDSQIKKLLHFSVPEAVELNDAIRKLITYQSAASFVHSIYVYSTASELFYVSVASNSVNAYNGSMFFDKEIIDILNNYKNYKMYYPIARDIPLPTSIDNPIFNKGYTYLFYEPSATEAGVNYAIVINISETWLRKTVNNLGTDSAYNTFIINREGNTIINSSKNKALSNIADKQYIKKILNSKESSGYFVDYADDTRALIIYSFYDVFDWVFVRTIPYDGVISEITLMRNKTVMFALLIFAFGMIGSMLVTKYLYKPIGSMDSRLKSLESERRSNLNILKQSLLRSIILGKNEPGLLNMQQQFDSLNIKLSYSGTYFVVLLIIDKYEDYISRQKPADIGLYKFALMNIASDIFGQQYNIECIDMENAYVAMCISLVAPSPMSEDNNLSEMINTVQESAQIHLEMSVSAIISSTDESITSLPKLYSEALHASYYRLYYGYKSIIFTKVINSFSLYDYSYPLQKEKTLVEALMLGKLDEMKSNFNDIMQNAVKYPYTTFHMSINHLTFAINTAIDTIEKSSGTALDYDFYSFITRLNRCETIDEITLLFNSLFDFIVNKLDERKESKYENLVNKIVEIVNNEYMQPDLTLESIADRVNMSHVYLGRLFKRLSSTSIVDYINNTRMKKAADFLASSNKPIATIAEQTGFTSSQYFHKLFKKTYGVTPNEYRNKAFIKK